MIRRVPMGHPTLRILTLAALLWGCQRRDVGAPRPTDRPLVGLNFTALGPGQKPGDPVSTAQVEDRLDRVAPYTSWVRTFGAQNETRQVAEGARERGLKVAAGAWITGDPSLDEPEIQALIALARDGLVDLAVVGSEALYRNDIAEADLVVHLRRVRAAIPGIPVTTADIYPTFPRSPALTRELDVLFYNAYPYWEGIDIDEAVAYFEACHEQVVAVADGRPVWVSETGWPTAGASVGKADASLDNQRRYLEEFRGWASDHNVPYFWFASFDESWKASTQEGAQGAHWGLWDEDGVLKADYFGAGR